MGGWGGWHGGPAKKGGGAYGSPAKEGGGAGNTGFHAGPLVVVREHLLQGAQPMSSHCPPDGKCERQWHL